MPGARHTLAVKDVPRTDLVRAQLQVGAPAAYSAIVAGNGLSW